jgi:hypothetical protein
MRFQSAVRNTATRLFIAVFVLCAVAGVALAQTPVVKPQIHSLSDPLVFEPNLGQMDAATRFAVHGLGYSLELQPNEARIFLSSSASNSARLQMKIDGAQGKAEGLGLEKMPSFTNYFIGADRSKWLEKVPHYGKVRFDQVYEGIDLLYYGTNGKLEYDFIVAPGADPSQVGLSFDGARSLSLVDGNLKIATTAGNVELLKPVVYQEVRGRRQTIESSYRLNGNKVRFNVGKYDPTLPLIIDPTLNYSFVAITFARSSEYAESVAMSTAGDVYVVGSLKNGTNWDAYVAKINSGGSLVYQTLLGGAATEVGLDLALVQNGVDTGKVFVAGLTGSSDFPNNVTLPPGMDGFLIKLGTTGGIESANRFGATVTDEQIDSVTVVPNGSSYDVLVAGATKSLVGSILAGVLTLPNQWYGYVAKADTTGAITTGLLVNPVDVFISTTPAGSATTLPTPSRSMKVAAGSAANEAYFAGTSSQSASCPSGAACTPASAPSGTKAVAVKVNTSGSMSISTVTWVGGSTVRGTSIVSVGGSAYLTGYATGAVTCSGCTAGAFSSPAGNGDAFVMKIGSSSAPSRFTYLGAFQTDKAFDIAIQGSNVVVTGETLNILAGQTEFPTLNAARSAREGQDAFITEFDSNLAMVASTFVGSTAGDSGRGIATNNTNAVVAGATTSPIKGFLSVLNNSGLSILSMTFSRCTVAEPCTVSSVDLHTTIATITVTLSGPLGTNDLQVVDGNTHIVVIGTHTPPGTTGSVYTFPVELETVPSAGETVGAVVNAYLNGTVGATQLMSLKGPEPLGGLSFTSNPSPANSPLGIIVQFGQQQTPNMSVRITKSSVTPANSADYLNFGGTATTLQQPIPDSNTTSLTFTVSTLNPAVDQTVHLRADLIGPDNNPTGVYLESGTDLVINPHVFKLPAVNGFTFTPTSVKGGTSLSATVALDCPAGVTPPSPQTVDLMYLTAGINGPASVTVPTGQCVSPSFTITTSPVATHTPSTVRGVLNGSLADGTFTVNAPVVTALSLNPTTVDAGQSSTGKITLDAQTPASGVTVNISSNSDPAVTYPATVTVTDTTAPYEGTFVIGTNPGPAATAVFTAAANGGSAQATLTIRRSDYTLSSVNLSATSVKGGTSFTNNTVSLACNPGEFPQTAQTVNLTSSVAGVTIVPSSVTIPTTSCTSGTFTVNTSAVADPTLVVITASLAINGAVATNNVTVEPPKVTALSLTPSTVNGGQNSTGKITLDGPTPTGGLSVAITSNNDAVVTYPPTVLVNDTTSPYEATFTIGNTSPAGGATVVFTATLNGTATATLTINAPVVFTLSSVNLSATSVTGGTSFGSNTVSLNCPAGAPTTPQTVTLSSNNAGVTLSPTSVVIPAGSCISPAFTVNTSPVASATPVVITATLGSSTKTANFTVNAPKVTALSLNPTIVNGGQVSLATITLDGPTPAAGIMVNISSSNNAVVSYPATVNVIDTTAPYQGTFNITAGNPTATTVVTFTAAANGGTASTPLTIRGAGGGIIPFSKFEVNIVVDLNRGDDDDNFFVDGDFTLGTATDGINPSLEDVTLKIGSYTLVIPKGSFNRQGDRDEDGDDDRRKPKEVWHFNGKIGNDRVHVHIHGYGSNQYNIRARVHRTDMTGVVNGTPIEVTLAVGNDGGSAVDSSPRVRNRIFDIKDLVLNPRDVIGGTSSTGTVTLKCSYGATPAVPVTITLTAEAGSGVTVPATVTIPAGPSCSASFPITTSAVSRTTNVTIKASYADIGDDWDDWFNWRGWFNNWQGWWRHTSESANLTVSPINLVDLDLNPSSVEGGKSSTGTVRLSSDSDALPFAVTVYLNAESGTGVTVPASVVIPAGGSSATFPVTTTVTTKTISAKITATLANGDQVSANLSVKKK